MTNESGIFDKDVFSEERRDGFYDYKLLKTSNLSKLWRAVRDGKYFLIKTTKDNSEHQLMMLRREYELSIGCDNPHIVHVFTYEHDIHEGDGIVMEYIEGRTLDEYLLEKPSLASRHRIFQELLSAVSYLHKRGIIHNDLKPENILITRADDTLKIIDFGLADNDAFYTWKTLGCTRKYASPELRSQSKDIDARSDIYSIGVMMREIFDGKYSRVVRKCCNEDFRQRYSDIADLQKAWADRNKMWRLLAAVCVFAAIVVPTFLYADLKIEEKRKIRKRELLIENVKSEIRQMFETALDSVEKIEDFGARSQYFSDFYNEYAEYNSQIMSEIQDPELRSILNLEMVMTTNEYWMRFNEYWSDY